MSAEKQEQIDALAHAMQTGVMYDRATGSQDGSPKHLRVGVDMAMIEGGALLKLLLAKGIIAEDEFQDTVLDLLRLEVASYENKLAVHFGNNIKLA